jgi:Protein of unknown function (DUF3306)
VSEEVTARLSRWSRRKLAARHGNVVDEPQPVGTAQPPAAAESGQPAGSAPAAESGSAAGSAPTAEPAAAPEPAPEPVPILPSIEELTAESDFTVFLAKTVPESIRRAALRKLWRSDPVLANLDGLVDYNDDYHAVDSTITAAQTAYRAGLGYVREAEERLQKVGKAMGALGGTPTDSRDEVACADGLSEPAPSTDEASMVESAEETVRGVTVRSDSVSYERPNEADK